MVTMKELSLFTGAGGGLLNSHILGWKSIGYVEWNDHCQRVIKQRIEDGNIQRAPIFSDIRTFISEGYATAYKGMVDVITAGFPCQPFSKSGKRKGSEDERNMWPATKTVIDEIQSNYVLLENVAALLSDRYIQRIFGELAEMGYDAKWGVLGGFSVGSNCNGERLWIFAFQADSPKLESMDFQKFKKPYTEESCRREFTRAISKTLSQDDFTRIKRNPNDVARGMERLKAIGNGQMGYLAAKALIELSNRRK